MARNKREGGQIKADRLLIERLYYYENWSMTDVQHHLNTNRPYTLSLATIARDCKVILEQMREAEQIDSSSYYMLQLKKLDNQERVLWEMYYRSLEPEMHVYEQEETLPGPPSEPTETDTEETQIRLLGRVVKTTKQIGKTNQVSILAEIRKVVELRSRLLGFITTTRDSQQEADRPTQKDVYKLDGMTWVFQD